MRKWGWLVLLFLAAGLAAQRLDDQPVPITSEPSHHLVLSNGRLRAFYVEAAPHASTLIHQHDYDYAFVCLGPAALRNAVVGHPPLELKLEDGEVHWAPGGFAHRITNLSDQPFRNVTVEILPRPGAPPLELPPMPFAAGTATTFVLDNERVRAFDVALDAGATLPRHAHPGGALLVPLTPVDLESRPEGASAAAILKKPGEVVWFAPGTVHALANRGGAAARFIILEVK